MANETINIVSDAGFEYDPGYFRGICTFGEDETRGNRNGALRFTGININQGQSLSYANLHVEISGVGSGSGSWIWNTYGMDEDNTGDFSGNPFGRTRTTASLSNNQGQPSSDGHVDFNVKSIVEEITSRGGWSSGNAIGFFMFDAGSSNGVYAVIDNSESYLSYRVSSEPNFKPTPKSVTAPTIPTKDDYGIRISSPGKNVLDTTLTDSEVYYTSGRQQFKILSEAHYTSTGSGLVTIAHNLGYVPFVMVYVKSSVFGGGWKKLPTNWAFETYPTYLVDDTNLKLYSAVSGEEFYYRIFLNQLQ